MKVLMLAVQLLFSTYDYSFEYGRHTIIEAVGFALNEASCTVKQDETSPSCIAYCYTSLEWLTLADLHPVCTEIIERAEDINYYGEHLKEYSNN